MQRAQVYVEIGERIHQQAAQLRQHVDTYGQAQHHGASRGRSTIRGLSTSRARRRARFHTS
ncbi:hypothetical protein Pth03_78260 [Planotetraspora thailandica]|uniref:Uncharacterized protein n=1 Tax=Planotetraspora thailandica TaxID=487172 RepID=A0A8J3Y217_9ACTN|nr:hypothetical protein Pth03_78260 [Planotetraspora thailandica]